MQVVKYDIENRETTNVVLEDKEPVFKKDPRGGSQVIRINENQRLAFVHETSLLHDPFRRKDGDYAHRVIVWDNDWNIIHTSEKFHFMGTFYNYGKNQDFNIEFVTGAAIHGDDILISFGFQDNASFILKMNIQVFFNFLVGN